MTIAGLCPHCGTRIRALGILRVSRRTPYRCAACGGKSVIPPSNGMRIVLGWVVAVALPGAMLDYLQVPRVGLFIFCAGAAGALPLIFARFCRFETKT